jgi:hypothetical protein
MEPFRCDDVAKVSAKIRGRLPENLVCLDVPSYSDGCDREDEQTA